MSQIPYTSTVLDRLSAFTTSLWTEKVLIDTMIEAIYHDGHNHCVMVIEVEDLDGDSDTVLIGTTVVPLLEYPLLSDRAGKWILEYEKLAIMEVHVSSEDVQYIVRSARYLVRDEAKDVIHANVVCLNNFGSTEAAGEPC